MVVCVFEFLNPFTFESSNFLISNLFSTFVSVLDVSTREVSVLLGHQKQRSPPLGSSLPYCLVTGRSTLKHPIKKKYFDFFLWYPTHTHQVSYEKTEIIRHSAFQKNQTARRPGILLSERSHLLWTETFIANTLENFCWWALWGWIRDALRNSTHSIFNPKIK